MPRGFKQFSGRPTKTPTDTQWELAMKMMEDFTASKKFRCDVPPADEIEDYMCQAFWNGTSHPDMLSGKTIAELFPMFDKQLKNYLQAGVSLGEFIAQSRKTLNGMETTISKIIGWQGIAGTAGSEAEALLDLETDLGGDMGSYQWWFAIWGLWRTKQLKANDDRFGWLFIHKDIAKRMETSMKFGQNTEADFAEATRRLHKAYPNGIHPSVSRPIPEAEEVMGAMYADIPSRPDL